MEFESIRDKYPVVNPVYIPIRQDKMVYLRAGPWSGPAITIREEPRSGDIYMFDIMDGNHTTNQIIDIIKEKDNILNIFDKLVKNNIIYFLEEGDTSLRPKLPIQGKGQDIIEREDILFHILSYGDIGPITAKYLDRVGVPFKHDHIENKLDIKSLNISESDFLIFLSSCHKPGITNIINERAMKENLSWVIGQVNGFDAIVGPVIIPNETACYQCFENRLQSNLDDNMYQFYYEGVKQIDTKTTLDPLIHLVESYICIELMRLIQFGHSIINSRIININIIDFEISINEVLKSPKCDVCSEYRDQKEFIGFNQVSDYLENKNE